MRRGFTLVEFLVAILIVSTILGAAYVTYITILAGFRRETASMETQIETAVGVEIIRLDLEHAGYGIGEDQPDLPVEWNNVNNSLIIRSVLNNTRLIRDTVSDLPVQWSLVECSGAGITPVIRAGDRLENLPTGTGLVFLGASSRTYIGETTDGSCPSSGVFVAIPYDTSVTNGCTFQFCNEIAYRLSDTQNLENCNPNTRNLLRAVGGSTGAPLINCVADVEFTFDIDRDGNGTVDVKEGNFLDLDPATTLDLDLNDDGIVSADEIRNGLRAVNIYMLVQDGSLDRKFRFTNYTSCSSTPSDMRLSGQCVVSASGIELNLPKDFANYRWKVIKLSVKPMNL